jgi:hypothetical protein
MVLLFDVLQVDALNDHGVFFGVQAGIDTEPANLRTIFFFWCHGQPLTIEQVLAPMHEDGVERCILVTVSCTTIAQFRNRSVQASRLGLKR